MPTLSAEQRARLRRSPSWIAHSGHDPDALIDRIQVVLEGLPATVAEALLDDLLTDPDRLWVRLAGIRLARAVGVRPVDVLDDHLVFEGEAGRFVVADRFWATPREPAGRAEDVERLTRLLDGTFQGRRYALYLRRAIPPSFDPTPVVRAVQLWLQAIDRGEWKGRHAIYEDDGIALEITLVPQRVDAPGGRVTTVGPIDALERLADVDAAVVEMAQVHGAAHPDLPLVLLLGARPRWRLSRGYVEQMFYGTAVQTHTVTGPGGVVYRAQFRRDGKGLFADRALASVGAVWWVEEEGPDPFGFHAWSHDNPWSEARAALPALPVSRFAAQGPDGERETLCWERRPATGWRSA